MVTVVKMKDMIKRMKMNRINEDAGNYQDKHNELTNDEGSKPMLLHNSADDDWCWCDGNWRRGLS